LRKAGFDHRALKTLEVSIVQYGIILPSVVACSSKGKLLHYNGMVKPWLVEKFTTPLPRCAIPERFPEPDYQWAWLRPIRVFCEWMKFVTCAELWSYYISEDAACALKDFDKEWTEDEEKWKEKMLQDEAARQRQEDRRVQLEKAQLENDKKLSSKSDDKKKPEEKVAEPEQKRHSSGADMDDQSDGVPVRQPPPVERT